MIIDSHTHIYPDKIAVKVMETARTQSGREHPIYWRLYADRLEKCTEEMRHGCSDCFLCCRKAKDRQVGQ